MKLVTYDVSRLK